MNQRGLRARIGLHSPTIVLLLFCLLHACLTFPCPAQLSYTVSGTGIQTFDVLPTREGGWTSAEVGNESSTLTTAAQVDARAQLVSAALITNALNATATVPPAQNGKARWNSVLQVIQSRTGNNAASALLSTLQNNSGADQNLVLVSYRYAALYSSCCVIAEEVPGQRVFYSTTGQSNSWTLIPELSGFPSTTFTNDLRATVAITGGWQPGALLYLLWMDDNAVSTEGSYTIDNFFVGPPMGSATITSPANDSDFPAGVPITVEATATFEGHNGTVSFYDGSDLLGTDSSFPYSLTTTSLVVGAHILTAIERNDTSHSVTSAPVHITVRSNPPPIIHTVSNHLAASHILVGSNLVYSAVVTDDGAVSAASFLVDGVLRWTDSIPPYTFGWDDITAGVHTLRVIATDNSGARSTNDSFLVVTNHPYVDVLLGNGLPWKYWDELTEPVNGNWRLPGYDDSGWSNGIALIGYGHASLGHPEVTVSRRIVESATNSTQLFRRHFNVPNLHSYTGLLVRVLAHDGAIVYLNGQEALRTATMPSGSVPFGAFALYSPDDGQVFGEYRVDKSLLKPGDNVAAVEVHQSSFFSIELSFDLMIWGARHVDRALRVVWPNRNSYEAHVYWSANARLEWTSEPGPNAVWNPVDPPYVQQNGENDFTFSMDPSQPSVMFFRVVQ